MAECPRKLWVPYWTPECGSSVNRYGEEVPNFGAKTFGCVREPDHDGRCTFVVEGRLIEGSDPNTRSAAVVQ